MVGFLHTGEVFEGASGSSFVSTVPRILDDDVSALITDLFCWLETEWQLPLPSAHFARPALPRPIVLTKGAYTVAELKGLCGVVNVRSVLRRYHIAASGSVFNKGRPSALYSTDDLAALIARVSVGDAPLLTESAYTVEEIIDLCGVTSLRYFYKLVRKYGLVPTGSQPSQGQRVPLYTKEDLAPALMQWEGDRLVETLNEWWRRFFPPACTRCDRCQLHEGAPLLQQLVCQGMLGTSLNRLRLVVVKFLRDVLRLGSVSAWWREHQGDNWESETHAGWGVVFIYLLDRRLIQLSLDELLHHKPLCSMDNEERTRLWRLRCPQEYQHFLVALQATNYRAVIQEYTLKVLSLLVLLRYGLIGLAELGRPLSTEEVHQACRERRLVTPHLGHGMFLLVPLSKDIRVGHVLLDEIRSYLWEYAAQQEPARGRFQREEGPRHWRQELVSAIEQALAAPLYEGHESVLSRRPETEQAMVNPWRLHQKGSHADTGYLSQPLAVQEHLMRYITFCHQEQGAALSTLQSRATALQNFFTWVRVQGMLADYPYWSRETAYRVFRAYASLKCGGMTVSSRTGHLRLLASFFAILAELECVVPPGSHLLSLLAKGQTWEPKVLPQEEILDRVFREGVCQLSYDPLARLALTIQYYCGTRVKETCELHVFCLLEDTHGHAYLLIPRGKTKQERPFPIVAVGMERLLDYMDQVVALRLSSEGTSRTLGRTNFRYLTDDPERANDWHYLFERVPIAEGGRKTARGKLSVGRVSQALHEAVLLAAKRNPDGFFQAETYSPICRQRRPKGMECRYFAAHDGITTCPRCGSGLSGHRGSTCRFLLDEEFVCNGVAQTDEAFCPKCDAPLASFIALTTHMFRHNSVSRAHYAGVSLPQNMRLHGHQTIPMHLRYLHLYVDETTQEVRQMFAEKRLREVSMALASPAGKIVDEGIASTVSLEQYLGITLRRTLKRRTSGIWGGFWAGALARRGVGSPLSLGEEMVILEESYEHTVAQYWYEALGLAVSEVAFEAATAGEWHAQVPAFLEREKIEALVQFHLCVIQDSLGSPLGRKLVETDVMEQRAFLQTLAEQLRPWWQHLGTIDQLVVVLAPGGGYAFQKTISGTEAVSRVLDTFS